MNVGRVRRPNFLLLCFPVDSSFFLQDNANTTYQSFMQKHGRVDIDADGWGSFSCFANNVQVWVKLGSS